MNRDALVIGVNRYPFLQNPETKIGQHLTTPAKDAEKLAYLLETQGKFTVKRLPQCVIDDKLQVDDNQQVTTEELKEAIANLFNPDTYNPPDVALLYFSGHGLRRMDTGRVTEGYLASSETSRRKNEWGISLQWLRQLLKNSPVRQQIVWLDCCKSGELFNFVQEDLQIADAEKVRFFISAARDFENAYSNLKREHGALTELLLKFLEPNQAINNGVIDSVILTKLIEGQLKLPQRPIIYCDQHRPINLTAIPEKQNLLLEKVQSMDKKQYLMERFQAEGGLDFIDVANHPKFPDLYPLLLSTIHDQLAENGMIGLLKRFQKTPSSENKTNLLQEIATQIDEDEKQVFTDKLMAIFQQFEPDTFLRNNYSYSNNSKQEITVNNSSLIGDINVGNQIINR